MKCKYPWVTNVVAFIGHHLKTKEVPTGERLGENSRDRVDSLRLQVRQIRVPV